MLGSCLPAPYSQASHRLAGLIFSLMGWKVLYVYNGRIGLEWNALCVHCAAQVFASTLRAWFIEVQG
jgi:hypothetical protein